ncbi:Uncharacterised protein [uncultured archaeon]|nr:Uncharacterised protein [uncultured archaeon]
MDKANQFLIVDVLALIAMLISAVTGIMVWKAPGIKIMYTHIFASAAFIALIIIHVLLHSAWIKNTLFRSR